MFRKKKIIINSQISIRLGYKIVINEKEIEQTQFLTENYVYTEVAGKKILYLPEKNKQYLIDTENKQLKEFDLSAQMIQMNQLKTTIGEVNTEERMEGETRHISIQNSPESPAKLKVDLQIIQYPGLEKMVFQKSNEFQQSMQMFSMELKPNEIVSFSESIFSINGQEQKSTLELTEIINKTEGIEIIDEFYNYKIKV